LKFVTHNPKTNWISKGWFLLAKYLFGDAIETEISLGKFVFFPDRADSAEIAGFRKIAGSLAFGAVEYFLFFLGAFVCEPSGTARAHASSRVFRGVGHF
jgi:hypothetical protein